MRDLTRYEEPIRKYSPSDEELEFFHGYEDEFDEELYGNGSDHGYGCRCRICREREVPFSFHTELEYDLLDDELDNVKEIHAFNDVLWHEREEEEFRVSALPTAVRQAFSDAKTAAVLWPNVVQKAVEAGITNSDTLANIVFFLHHPERIHAGTGLSLDRNEPEFDKLAEEWRAWRTVVKKIVSGVEGGKVISSTSTRPTVSRINTMVDESRGLFRISKKDESTAAKRLWKKTKFTNTLGGYSIAKVASKFPTYGAHIRYSMDLFNKTSIVSFKSGRDVNFVIAIATREGGTRGVFRTDNTKVVSAGRDVHYQGVSGLDYLFKRAKYFKQAGIPIWKVSKSELRKGKKNRAPAIVYAKHLLFSHMVEVANREYTTWKKHLREVLKKNGESGIPKEHFNNLSKNARRTWAALTYSGGRYVRGTMDYIIKDQKRRGAKTDFNAIMTLNFTGFRYFSRVILARATSLRAHVFDHLV